MTRIVRHPALTATISVLVTASAVGMEQPGDDGYREAFVALHETLGRRYPCFELKGIDWPSVGGELIPRVDRVTDDVAFGQLCLELVARLEDSHAVLLDGSHRVPWPEAPSWDAGFACLLDDRGAAVVYEVTPGSSAARAGIRPGLTLTSFNGLPASARLAWTERQLARYVGHSSDRRLRYDGVRALARVRHEGAPIRCVFRDPHGETLELDLTATSGRRYLRRLPVPIAGIDDSAHVGWTMLDGEIGYIYVRRIRDGLEAALDAAVAGLAKARGMIVDVRGNSGGGFDGRTSHLNFGPAPEGDATRPVYGGPIAVLLDARCISAGEGWASWFIATGRARTFGETTAGASARKTTYTMTNGLYRVRFPVKAYRGFLDRPIERIGLVPDVPVMPNAVDLAAGRDTALEAARAWLLTEERAAP